MDLKTYVSTARGESARVARQIGVTPAFFSQILSGRRKVPAAKCPAIEQATAGAVRCEDLRPDVAWGVLRTGTHVITTPQETRDAQYLNP